jgi:hypothetical protein
VNVLANTRVPVLVIPEVARFENFLKKGKTGLFWPLILMRWKMKAPLIFLRNRHVNY